MRRETTSEVGGREYREVLEQTIVSEQPGKTAPVLGERRDFIDVVGLVTPLLLEL